MSEAIAEPKPQVKEEPLFAHLNLDLAAANAKLEESSAEDRVAWALENFSPRIILASSFGAQAAVSLHMASRQWPDIPVVLVDTGYLFPETYEFVDRLTDQLKLNLKVYRANLSPAWQEARYGKLWEQGVEGIGKYNALNKVEPMNRALDELDALASFAGLRRQHSEGRSKLPVLTISRRRLKIHPIIDWTDRDVYRYLGKNGLPYNPLWDEGYVSIGDTHTTQKPTGDMTAEQTRFFGLKRECGLHEGDSADYSI